MYDDRFTYFINISIDNFWNGKFLFKKNFELDVGSANDSNDPVIFVLSLAHQPYVAEVCRLYSIFCKVLPTEKNDHYIKEEV